MNPRISPRLWATFGVGIVAVVGLGLLLVFLSRGPGAPAPITTSAIPTPSDEPVVASVNEHSIKYSFWMEAVLLDQVMSELTGQSAPLPDETLQRLINEELVLETFPPEQSPTAAQIEEQIAALEQAWGVEDISIVAALENAGLTRAAFERAIGRLLAIQAGLEALHSQGYDTSAWLEEQRAGAEIVLNQKFENAVAPYTPVAQSPLETPTAFPPPTPIPTPVPATELPPPTPALVIPEAASDFTLTGAKGITLTLSEQLAHGPVVLVFFQRGGG